MIAVLMAGSATAIAQSAADKAAEFVIGNCYRSIDDISRVASMASVMKWQSLSADVTNAMKPVDAKDYQAWQVRHEGQLYLLAVNRGMVSGKATEVCSVVVPTVSPQQVISAVLKNLKNVKLVDSDKDGFQINEAYRLDHPTAGAAMLHLIKAVDGQPPVNFTFMGTR